MKKRTNFVNIAFFIVFLFICFIVAEIGLRIVLFKNITLFAKLKNPAFYADYFSEDDYWKLHYLFGCKACPPLNPHPVLGWVGDFSRDDFIHNKTKNIDNRRPVFLYGDSFAECRVPSPEKCFQGILNTDKTFSKDNYLMNYAVGGYGVDQIYLLFKETVNQYKNPFVIISIFVNDIDRSILSVRGGQKPTYRIKNNELILNEVPINPNPKAYFINNPPQIRSYLYRLILYNEMINKMPLKKSVSFLKREKHFMELKFQINEKLINEIIKELRTKGFDFVFLIFHPVETTWRDYFLKELLHKNNVPYIWSRDIMEYDIKVNGHTFYDFFIPGDGHPSEYLIRLLSEEIKRYVLQAK